MVWKPQAGREEMLSKCLGLSSVPRLLYNTFNRYHLLAKLTLIGMNFLAGYFWMRHSTIRPRQTRTRRCRHIVADTNVSPFAHARDIYCGHKICFWFCSQTFCDRHKCFPVCVAWKPNIHFVSRPFARPRNIMNNNVSATMCPRLPGPLGIRNEGWTIPGMQDGQSPGIWLALSSA